MCPLRLADPRWRLSELAALDGFPSKGDSESAEEDVAGRGDWLAEGALSRWSVISVEATVPDVERIHQRSESQCHCCLKSACPTQSLHSSKDRVAMAVQSRRRLLSCSC